MQNFVGKQIDRYRIVESLGMGGMAVVYKAYDVRLQRDVAFKLIRTDAVPASGHERLVQRFEREARAMAKLSHPNIVSVHDYGDHEGAPYLVMAYVPRGTLKDLIGSPIDHQKAAAYLIPIADALAYAHDHGILHRDVKPSNILITAEDIPMLTDFGIAKILEEQDSSLTSTGFGVGTPQYMAPEQWRNEVCSQTDIYSLGTIFYELVTGQKPYDAETPAAIAIKQATEPLVRPREFVSDIPDSVEKVIYKALAFKPLDRYEDMQAFRDILQQLRDGQSAENIPDLISVKLPSKNAIPWVDTEMETHDALDISPSDSHQAIKQSQISKKRTLPNWVWWAGAGVGVVALLCVVSIFIINRLLPAFQDNEQTPVSAREITTQITVPTLTSIPKTSTQTLIVHTATATIAPTETLAVGATRVNDHDGAEMLYVPAGEFLMGSEDEDAYKTEKPEHIVYLDAYWIYKYEVTNSQFRRCIEAGVCSGNLGFYSKNENPAVYINWHMAESYCEWVGGRLPTEAEWEKAARGDDGRTYPWGETRPSCGIANFYGCRSGTAPVGSYLGNASPYGALDMAGNVWEWVADWYGAEYYAVSPYSNPTGPATGTYRVVRGGSWSNNAWYLRTSDRLSYKPDTTDQLCGFRCAFSP